MTGWVARPGRWVVWAIVVFFFVNLAGVVLSVVVDSFGKQWFGTWLPDGFTTGSGMGMGLGGSKRLVNEFSIDSRVGEGTRVTITRWK